MFKNDLDMLAQFHAEAHAAWDAESEDPLDDSLVQRSLAKRTALVGAATRFGMSVAEEISSKIDRTAAHSALQAAFAHAALELLKEERKHGSRPPKDQADQELINLAIKNLFQPIGDAHRRAFDTTAAGTWKVAFEEMQGAHEQAVAALVAAVEANSNDLSLYRASVLLGDAFAKVTKLAEQRRTDQLS